MWNWNGLCWSYENSCPRRSFYPKYTTNSPRHPLVYLGLKGAGAHMTRNRHTDLRCSISGSGRCVVCTIEDKSSAPTRKYESFLTPDMASKKDQTWHRISQWLNNPMPISGIVFWRHVWRQKACVFSCWERTFVFDSTYDNYSNKAMWTQNP